jgi:hypothetical protein
MPDKVSGLVQGGDPHGLFQALPGGLKDEIVDAPGLEVVKREMD